MSWAALANNQCISLNNLQNAVNTGVFTLKNAIPSSSKQITKADAFFYVNIDAAYPPYANKASNQLVVKSDLVAGSGGSITILNATSNGVLTNVTPSFYTINSGSFPLTAFQFLTGTPSTFSGTITINVGTVPTAGGSITISVNAAQVDCIPLIAAGLYNSTISVLNTDVIEIALTEESCP